MNLNEKDKNTRKEDINSLLLRLRSQLEGLYAFNPNTFERNILQHIYPHIHYIQNDINKLFSQVEMEHPEQEIKQNPHRGFTQ